MPSNPSVLTTVKPDSFINMMRGVPAAVTVVAADHNGKRRGLTATAVCSLSADPPQLLVCINRHSPVRQVIAASGMFSVNFLSSRQETVARRFSEPNVDPETRFTAGRWRRSETGAPVLDDTLASAVCVLVSESLQETHAVYIGRVVESLHGTARPLLYHDRTYRGVTSASGT